MSVEQFVNVARWQSKVRALFGVDGANPVPTLKDIIPVVVIENDRDDWGFAGQERPGGNVNTQALVAGEFGQIGLLNPIGSGVITTVRQVENLSAIAVNLKIGRITEYVPNAPVDIAIPSIEPREWSLSAAAGAGLTPRLATFMRRGSNAAVLGLGTGWFTHRQLGAFGAAIQTFTPVQWSVTLSEGMALVIEAQVVATQIVAQYLVRERAQESGKGS